MNFSFMSVLEKNLAFCAGGLSRTGDLMIRPDRQTATVDPTSFHL